MPPEKNTWTFFQLFCSFLLILQTLLETSKCFPQGNFLIYPSESFFRSALLTSWTLSSSGWASLCPRRFGLRKWHAHSDGAVGSGHRSKKNRISTSKWQTQPTKTRTCTCKSCKESKYDYRISLPCSFGFPFHFQTSAVRTPLTLEVPQAKAKSAPKASAKGKAKAKAGHGGVRTILTT